MTEDENYFRKWFVDVLEPLRDKGDAGFVFAVVSFPLLERYLREKSDAGQASTLPQEFFDELGSISRYRWKRERLLALLSKRSPTSSGVFQSKNWETH